MPSLKDIKRRIGSVKKTRQITKAMKMVAGARLRRATENALQARPYRDRLEEVLGRLAAKSQGDLSDPLLEQREEVKRVLVVFYTSDRGLCGGFNNTLLRRGMEFLQDKTEAGATVSTHVFGRKGVGFLSYRNVSIDNKVTDYAKTPVEELVGPLSATLVNGFTDGTYDQVFIAYNRFVNTITQVPEFQQILPLSVPASESGTDFLDYIYEPSSDAVLGAILPLYLRTLLSQAFLETAAGEQAARMTAMDNATRNAGDLIDKLTLQYNRARQAAITTELIEIVSGAEAL